MFRSRRLADRVGASPSDSSASDLITAAAVTVPVAVLLATIWAVPLRRHDQNTPRRPTNRVVFWYRDSGRVARHLDPTPELVAGLACAILLTVRLLLREHADEHADEQAD
ncbi:MAG: hypothetical protein ACR2KG_13015 [Nocardioidaceae bacterium]